MDLLQEYLFVPLDIFREIKHNKIKEEIDAWLHCIASDEPEVIQAIIEKYPQFEAIYAEISLFRQDVGGVLNMFSEALRILDQNTVQYMIDDLKEQIVEKDVLIETQSKELEELSRRIEELEKQLK